MDRQQLGAMDTALSQLCELVATPAVVPSNAPLQILGPCGGPQRRHSRHSSLAKCPIPPYADGPGDDGYEAVPAKHLKHYNKGASPGTGQTFQNTDLLRILSNLGAVLKRRSVKRTAKMRRGNA